MEQILTIILSTIGAAGGIGTIIYLIIKVSVKKIAKCLEERYKLSLTKELELYKNELKKEVERLNFNLEKKNYISKILFDIQVDFYKKLSEAFFDVVFCANNLIPPGLNEEISDSKIKEEVDRKNYDRLCHSTLKAQSLLNSSIPFIILEQYEKYTNILKMANLQITDFNRRWCENYLDTDKYVLPHTAYLRSNEMMTKFKEISLDVKDYLSNLKVID